MSYNRSMRSFLKAAVLALAVVVALPVAQLSAQANGPWKKISVKEMPATVQSGYHRRFSHSKVTKVEKSGTGKATVYRLTIHNQKKGKPQVVLFDVNGRAK